MRAVIQRAAQASCTVEGQVTGEFSGPGLVVLLGVTHEDGPKQVETMVRKIANLRIFDSDDGQRGGEVSALSLGLPVLLISQFTLYGDARKGNRPSWTKAAPGEVAEGLVEAVATGLEELGMQVGRGIFGANMQISLVNDGPVTILLEV